MRILPHRLKENNIALGCRRLSNHLILFSVLLACPWIQLDSRGQNNNGTALSQAPSTDAAVKSKKEEPTLGSISGHVTTDDGQPLPRARVSIVQFGTVGRPITVSVGSDGAFRR